MFEGFLPDKNWCDALVDECDIDPMNFICPNSRKKYRYGESAYVLNKNVLGKKLAELPPDIVLIFETNPGSNKSDKRVPIENRESFHNKDSLIREYFKGSEKVYKHLWNQVGEAELLGTENHKNKWCSVLFGDLHAGFVKTEELSKLKWKVE